MPGGTGVFTAFPESPALSASITAFLGSGVGQQGVYGSDVLANGPPIKVADLTTAIPGGTGTFTGFSDLSLTTLPVALVGPPIKVAFLASGAGQQGVYVSAVDQVLATGPPIKVADLSTTIPGGTGTFTAFSDLSLSTSPVALTGPPIKVAFLGSGVGQQGVYGSDVLIVGPPIKVADLTTAIPGGTGTFTGFTAVSTSLGHTAFLGLGNFGQAGIYRASTLTKVIAVGDTLGGKVITELRFGRSGLDGGTLAFGATFADGSEGVFVVDVNQPFAAFDAKVEIDLGPRANDDEFAVKATFTLGAGSNGVDIPTEIVSLQLTGGTGAFSTTIPAGSFKQDKNKKGRFKFEGTINGVKVEASIRPLGGSAFEFKAEGKRAELTGLANPVTVKLTIGDDGGSAIVTAKFE